MSAEGLINDEQYTVYWIHLLTQNDPFMGGYVGVACDLERRWHRHRQHAKLNGTKRNRYPLYAAFRRHGLACFSFELIASRLDKRSAYNLEYALRPHSNIGYNIEPGGYWRSCLACSSLTPLREFELTKQRIAAHIKKVVTYRSSTEQPG